jgi:hypothetical protein
LARARSAAARLAWAEAFEALTRAGASATLPAEDLELLATAYAYQHGLIKEA